MDKGMKRGGISIEGKTILVTGAFGLFGREVCQCYLDHGANVILCGHDPERVDFWNEELAKKYDRRMFLVSALEITDTGSIQENIKKSLDKFNTVDVLVNNAAIDAKFDKNNVSTMNHVRFECYPIELIRRAIDINMIGMIQMTQLICRQMLIQGHGNIINVGSIYSLIAPNRKLYDFGEEGILYKPVDYVVSKSFIPNFTRYVATFYAKDGIRCNALAPHGVLDHHEDRFVRRFSDLSPMGRMCDREELDGPFLFLASDSSSYITGTTLVVDGGWTAW